jgi:hypothetical protein
MTYTVGGVYKGAEKTLEQDRKREEHLYKVWDEMEKLKLTDLPAPPDALDSAGFAAYVLRIEAITGLRKQQDGKFDAAKAPADSDVGRMRAIMGKTGENLPSYAEANRILEEAYEGAPKKAENAMKAACGAMIPVVGSAVGGMAWRCVWHGSQGKSFDGRFIENEVDELVREIAAAAAGGAIGKAAGPALQWVARKFPEGARKKIARGLETALDKLTDPVKDKCGDFLVDLSKALDA